MQSVERRQRDKTRVRGKILDAARELFAQRGFASVTMRSIAAKIGYTPTTIYLYFQDKDSLIRELCTADFLTLAESFRGLVSVTDPVERLRGLGFAYLAFARTHPNHYRLMFMDAFPEEPRNLAKGNPDEDAYAFLRTCVADVVAAGGVKERFRDVDLTAQILWSMMHGLVSLQIAKGDHQWVKWRPPEVVAAEMMRAMEETVLEPHG